MAINYPDGISVFKLSENANGYEYYVYPASLDPNQEKPSTSINIPGKGPRDNIQLGVQGMTLNMSLNLAVWEDGEDRANGTYTSQVVTVRDQIEYIYQEIHNPSFDVDWTFEQVQGYPEMRLPPNDSGNRQYKVQVENVRIPMVAQESPKWVRGTIDLIVGGSV